MALIRVCIRRDAAAIAMLAMIIAGGGAAAEPIPPFYAASASDITGRPGTIIRQQALTGYVPPDATAWRILYRSAGLHGEPVAVSAVLVVPNGPAPAGGRPIVAWQHPTSGITQACAPSLSPDVLKMVMGLPALLQHGFAVVATDYPGLGTAGPHPYLVGESEGHAVLDAVRAVRNLPQAQAGDRFAVWGHSQGGHATLNAGLLAHSYAPDLHLVGVAAAAPATDLVALAAGADTADSELFTAMLISAWSRVYHLPIGRLIAPGDQPHALLLARQCFDPPLDDKIQPPGKPMPDVRYRLRRSIGATEPWRSIASRNSPGPLPADVPVFLAQGGADTTIPPAITANYMRRLCQAGVAVRMLAVPEAIHRLIARDAAGAAVDWIADRFAGKPPANDCP